MTFFKANPSRAPGDARKHLHGGFDLSGDWFRSFVVVAVYFWRYETINLLVLGLSRQV